MNEIFKQQFLTQQEVAERFRVSTKTIGNWTKSGIQQRRSAIRNRST